MTIEQYSAFLVVSMVMFGLMVIAMLVVVAFFIRGTFKLMDVQKRYEKLISDLSTDDQS